jgi:hypothetical protein
MADSFVTYLGDDSTTDFDVTFPYMAVGHIEVYLDGVLQVSGYTVNEAESPPEVEFSVPPTGGSNPQLVKIARATPRTVAGLLVTFANNASFDANDVDTLAQQLLYISQEAFDKTGANEFAYDSTLGQWDAAVVGVQKPIGNVDDPTGDQQVATKAYVDNVAAWGITGVPKSYQFTATGTQTYTLAGSPNAEAEYLVVSVNGIIAVPTVDFVTAPLNDTDSALFFIVAPPAGWTINVQNFGIARYLDNIVIDANEIIESMIATNVVSTRNLAPNAVTAAEIATGAVGDDEIAASSIKETKLNLAAWKSAPGGGVDHALMVDQATGALSSRVVVAADLSDLAATVKAYRLDEFAVPTINLNLNSKKIVSLADPTANQDAATKAYVDSKAGAEMPAILVDAQVSGSSPIVLDWEAVSAAYNHIEVVWERLGMQTRDAINRDLRMRIYLGGTLKSGSNYNNWTQKQAGAVITPTETIDGAFVSLGDLSTLSDPRGSLHLHFHNAAGAEYVTWEGSFIGFNNGTGDQDDMAQWRHFGAFNTVVGELTGLQFYGAGTYNFRGSNLKVYGW